MIYYEKIHEKIVRTFLIDVQNVKYMLDTYFCPNSIKIENQTVSKVTKKEGSLSLKHAEPSEVKSLACPCKALLVCVN